MIRQILLAFSIVVLASSTSRAQSIPESTEGDRANTGRVAYPAFETEPTVLWKYSEGRMWIGGIAIHDNVLVAIERQTNRIIGVNAETGEEIWATAQGDVFSFGMGLAMTCVKDFDAVIVGCDSGLIALDRLTGEELWNYKTDFGCNGPTISGGLVFAGGADGNVHAVELKSGKLKWTHDYLKDAPEDPPGFDGDRARFEGRPARPMKASTDGKAVFLSVFDQCRTLAIEIDSGKRRWAFQTQGWTRSQPTVAEEAVFLASQDKRLYAVDKDSGRQKWSIKTEKWNSTSAAVSEDLIVFGSNDGHLYCILREMGASMWEYNMSFDGSERTGIYSRPLIAGNTVYAASTKGALHAIDLKTGKAKWKFKPSKDSEITGDLHFDNGKLYLYTRRDGEKGEAAIFAFGETK